jgi:hypothetical protein
MIMNRVDMTTGLSGYATHPTGSAVKINTMTLLA